MKSALRIRITVRGRLSQRLAGAFDGMTLTQRRGVSELAGVVVDHAQLHGLLTRIRDLGLELGSVSVTDAHSPHPNQSKGARS
jgi:hypothetical protein